MVALYVLMICIALLPLDSKRDYLGMLLLGTGIALVVIVVIYNIHKQLNPALPN